MGMTGDVGIGQVVKSTMGRDKGRYFIVVKLIDEQHVAIADGILRKADRPKKKKIKHLEPKPALSSTILEKLTGGKRVFDQELRACLDELGFDIKKEIQEG